MVPVVLQYLVCDVELPNPGKYPYPGFIQKFIHDLILGLPYPGKFPYPGISLILSKLQYAKSEYLFEINNNKKQKLSGLNYSL